MLKFVSQKMWNKKWIMLCLLIGNIFMISIACMNPLYSDAVQKKALASGMSNYIEENNRYPGTIVVDAAITVRKGENNAEKYVEALKYVDEIKESMGVSVKEFVNHRYLPNIPCVTQSKYGDSPAELTLSVGAIENVEQHINIVTGECFSDRLNSEGLVEAIISEKGMITQKLLVGEVLEFDAIRDENNQPLRIKIVGVFENSEEDDLFWVNSPSTFTSEILISDKIFSERYENFEDIQYALRGAFHILLDYEDMQENQLKSILKKTQNYKNIFKEDSAYTFRAYYEDILEEHVLESRKVTATLGVLQVPILVLLAAFIFMVSRQILEIEQNEISILKSRGASKKQILITYLIQSSIIAGISLVIGIPLGAFLCQVLGSANSFLGFVSRRALDLHFTWKVVGYAFAAIVVSIVAMILPVFKFADLTIVEQKQKRDLKKKQVWWQRYFVDVLCLVVSLYGLYSFNGQKAELAKKVAEGSGLDPLMFLSSSLFIIGASLVSLRLIPLVINLIFKSRKDKWNPSLYASFLRVLRTRNKQQFIMVFLMLTIALGIFNAYSARTINTNAEDRIRYTNGSDVVLKEQWGEEEEEETEASSTDLPEGIETFDQFEDSRNDLVTEEEKVETDLVEPDFEKFQLIDGVEHVAKIYMDEKGSIPVANADSDIEAQQVTIMGVNTKELGETGWFKDNLLPQHWYHYLNAIAKNSSAILVSQNFRDKLGYNIGDVITYTTGNGSQIRGVIYGFVKYWPTYNSVTLVKNADGTETEMDHFMIVSHLSKLQANDGVLPYYVWLDLEGSTQGVYDFIGENQMKLDSFTDSYAEIIELKNDPVIQGTNGILTVSFIVVLLLCGVGFLIFWIISIRSRALQFGIFRAMGMSMKEILVMLAGEQIFITGSSILVGTAIGLIASYLYIPLLQIAYGAADSMIPLEIESAGSDLVKIFIVVALIIGACMVVLGKIIKEIKISQALKLGED